VSQAEAKADRLPRFVHTSAEQVASEGLSGAARGLAVVVPGVVYKAMVGAVGLTPRALVRRIAGIATR
jgi:short-subunit dehydrogenase